MQIGGLQKLTLIDYPGKIACSVFCLGCNFRCPFCYNRELVLPEEIKKQLHHVKSRQAGILPKAKLSNGKRISEKEFFDFLKERKELLEGICITGGEPTINKDLPSFIKKVKNLGYLVKLDTNGSNPEMLKKLIDEKLVDYVAMDIKQSQKSKVKSQKYDEATGAIVDLNKIKKSIEIIKNSEIDYEFRTTVVPGIHTREDIIEIAKEISPAKKYYLQNFRPQKTIDPKFEKIKPYSDNELLEIQKAIAPFFETCQVR